MNIITLGQTSITQSSNGLYCLTDLWKSSGGLKKNQPSDFMKLKSTKETVQYLLDEKVGALENQQVVAVVNGDKGLRFCESL